MSRDRFGEETILEYALHALNAEKIKLNISEYSKKYNLDYKRLSNIHYKIFWLKIGSNKERTIREMYVEHAKKFLSMEYYSISKYIREESLERSKFTVAIWHLKYWIIINKHNEQQNNIEDINKESIESEKIEPMKFISIKSDERLSIPPIKEPEPEQELIKKKNEIELNISKGIKVIVDSDVNTETMIRIIELLKDL